MKKCICRGCGNEHPLAETVQGVKTLEQKIMQVLEKNDGRCLDTEYERQRVCDDLFKLIFPHDN